MSMCTRCGWQEAKAKGLCSPCRQYQWKYRKPRPAPAVMRHVERANDRQR
jgi:predicted ATP-dependent serine protease